MAKTGLWDDQFLRIVNKLQLIYKALVPTKEVDILVLFIQYHRYHLAKFTRHIFRVSLI